MSLAPGAYRRLTGVLRLHGHSPILEVDDGSILRLVSGEDLAAFDAIAVIVEGTLSASRLQVAWIGVAPK